MSTPKELKPTPRVALPVGPPEDVLVPVPLSLLQRIGQFIEGVRECPEGHTVRDAMRILIDCERHAQAVQAKPKPDNGNGGQK